MPGVTEDDATLNTVTFTEQDGRTFMTSMTDAPSREVRDASIETGKEAGMQGIAGRFGTMSP